MPYGVSTGVATMGSDRLNQLGFFPPGQEATNGPFWQQRKN